GSLRRRDLDALDPQRERARSPVALDARIDLIAAPIAAARRQREAMAVLGGLHLSDEAVGDRDANDVRRDVEIPDDIGVADLPSRRERRLDARDGLIPWFAVELDLHPGSPREIEP